MLAPPRTRLYLLPAPSRIGALLWLGCLQFFVCEQLARLGWVGHYSLRFLYISDLGTVGCALTCSHFHALMNASFATQGVLIAGGALLLRRSLLPGLSGGSACALLLLSALGVAALAYAPSDVDANLHISAARLHLACGALGMLCAAFSLRRNRARLPAWTALAAQAFLACGALAALGDFLLVFGGPAQATLGIGTVERLAAYPLPLCLAFTGALALRAEKRPRPRD